MQYAYTLLFLYTRSKVKRISDAQFGRNEQTGPIYYMEFFQKLKIDTATKAEIKIL